MNYLIFNITTCTYDVLDNKYFFSLDLEVGENTYNYSIGSFQTESLHLS